MISIVFGWVRSRRLQLVVTTVCSYAILLSLFRVLFYFEFSGIENTSPPALAKILEIFYIGFKFDLRLAILLCLPLMALVIAPRVNLFRCARAKTLSQIVLGVITLAVVLLYVFDFGYYSYLGLRLDASILRFLEDRESTLMVWQSYPVIRLSLGVIACCAAVSYLNNRLHHYFTAKPAKPIAIPAAIIGCLVVGVAMFFGLLGRYSGINFYSPYPLRWSAVHATQNAALAATGINPVLYFFETLEYKESEYDFALAKRYYDVVADYLAVSEKNPTTLSLARAVGVQPHKLDFAQTPNVVFIMLESLGASRLSAYGLPFESTPTLDHVAKNSLFFRNFYVPVSGTSRTVWASLTGIPDTSTRATATRNPRLSHQRMTINAFTEHEKLYMIGGNAGWANMNALLQASIDGITLYEEGDWQSPIVDAWGISDLALFQESDKILRAKHQANNQATNQANNQANNQPFFAIIQTAGNHRPFTIPEQRGHFTVKKMDADLLSQYGFRSNAQFNAVRLLDYSLGEFFRLAKQSGYFDNTIFVMYGDHNNRITRTRHMPPFLEELDLDELHVPGMIYAPQLLPPQTIEDAVSLVDLMPTVAGLLGVKYTNTTFGRDVFNPTEAGERYVFTLTYERTNQIIGLLSDKYMLRKYARKNAAELYDLNAADPAQDISATKPKLFNHLKKLAQGVYEQSRYQMYHNRDG